MGRRILMIVLVLAVALFAYVGYNSYDARRSGVSGDVFSKDSVTGKAKTEITNPPANAGTASNEGQTVIYPDAANPVSTQPPVDQKTAPATQPAENGPPAADTIGPNPPNGMVFSGSGKYQIYRQGNLTWRINTVTGDNCILFATDEEWKKPKVYRHGCRR